MKKILSLIAGFIITFGILTTSPVQAETLNDLTKIKGQTDYGNTIDGGIIKPKYLPEFDTSEKESYKAAQSVIYKAINLILFVAGTVAVLILIGAGTVYVVNAGVEDMQNKAKDMIIYAIAGLLAIFLSYTIIENTVEYLYDENKTEQYQELDKLEQKDVVTKP